ncbi:MAG: trypsin-like peptidase domain-containing protein [Planctomycetaceae bacterium]
MFRLINPFHQTAVCVCSALLIAYRRRLKTMRAVLRGCHVRMIALAAAIRVILAFSLCATSAWAADPNVLKEQDRRIDVIQRMVPAAVAIFSADGNGGGSGVLISPDGYTVTNYHVIEGLGPFMKCGLNDGQLYDAVIVGIDPTGDVALIKLLGRDDFPQATIGDSNTVRVGDWAYAVGNPFLLATNLQPTVSYGVVSGVHRYQYPAGTFLEYTDCIQVDASINPGNSGGPLFNDQGELIGINGRASFEKRGRVNSGAGYAISINQVRNFLDHLKSGRIVDHATLGATVTGSDDGAVYVANILEQSAAYRRGLRINDEIVSFGGRPIRSVNQFKNILGIYPKGWTVPLVYRRDEQKQELHVRLRALHRQAELTPDARPDPQPDEPDQPEQPDPNSPDEDQPPSNPHHAREGRPDPPAQYAHLFVEKSGFTNWYFNEQERTRALTGLRQLGDFHSLKGTWELTGQLADGRLAEFKLNDRAAAADLAGTAAVQPADQPFTDAPEGSGGLLAALYQFRRLLVDPNDYFTEFYYLGSEPLDGGEERVDVVIATRGTVTSRWYFSRRDGRFAGWDTTLEEDADECRVRIDSFRDFDALRFPAQLTVSHADQDFARLTISGVRLSDQ